MKKTKIILLLALSVLLLVGCSGNNQVLNNDDNGNEILDEIKDNDVEQTSYDISVPWEIEGYLKLKIDKIYTTDERNIDSNKTQYTNQRPTNVYKLQYTYENLDNSDGILNKRIVVPTKIVTDRNERALNYPLYEINHPAHIGPGEIYEKAEYGFAFDDDEATNIKIYFDCLDNENNKHEIVYSFDLNNIVE